MKYEMRKANDGMWHVWNTENGRTVTIQWEESVARSICERYNAGVRTHGDLMCERFRKAAAAICTVTNSNGQPVKVDKSFSPVKK